jgi:hypothetical protein
MVFERDDSIYDEHLRPNFLFLFIHFFGRIDDEIRIYISGIGDSIQQKARVQFSCQLPCSQWYGEVETTRSSEALPRRNPPRRNPGTVETCLIDRLALVGSVVSKPLKALG